MALLRIDLLGGVRFQLSSGADIALQTRKGRLLLAFLALMPGRAQSCARLIELLWSGRPEAQARASLRQELHALRRSLAGIELPVLEVAGDFVALKANAVVVDVAAFERWVDRGDRDALERAAALYRGDLLDGMSPAGAAFEEWLAFERRRLRALAIETLSRLLMLQMEDGVGEAAARTARTLLAWEETHEGAHRALMFLLARRCDRNAALSEFQLCRAVLARELGVEPDAETAQLDREMLYRAPRTPTMGPSRSWDSGGSDSSVAALPIDASERGTRVSDGIAALQTERRQLAVIFVDMVRSTALAARLDPEKLRDVLDSFHQATAETVARFDGRVVERRGDGMLACFGWPQAHEDDAERAVRAGLAAVEAIGRLRASDAEPLACRVGVVVVEELDAGLEVWGETAHLAARLHALGPPGAVVLTEPTRRVLGQLFAYESSAPSCPKASATPVDTWRVVGDGMVASRFEALRGSSLTPLVGRRQELALLLDRWRQASGGEGQVVLLSGEAGIGKSRLVRALRERLIDAPHTALGLFCSPHHGNTMLFPVLRLLERVAGLRRADPPERQLDLLEAMLALAGEHEPEAAPLLADLLEIADTGRYPRPALTPARKKERTLRALLGQLTGLAARGPVLAVYDDVHWADPTTLELLRLVIDRVQQAPGTGGDHLPAGIRPALDRVRARHRTAPAAARAARRC